MSPLFGGGCVLESGRARDRKREGKAVKALCL